MQIFTLRIPSVHGFSKTFSMDNIDHTIALLELEVTLWVAIP